MNETEEFWLIVILSITLILQIINLGYTIKRIRRENKIRNELKELRSRKRFTPKLNFDMLEAFLHSMHIHKWVRTTGTEFEHCSELNCNATRKFEKKEDKNDGRKTGKD